MNPEFNAEWVLRMLAAQGVKSEHDRAQIYAAALSQLAAGAAPGYAKVAFEEEPAGYVVEMRRNAP
jgi:hypothetical protein